MGPGTGRLLVAAGVAAAATVVVDQASKAIVRGTMEPGEFHSALDHQVSVGHVQNHGSAYGLLGEVPAWLPAVGTAVVGAGLVAAHRGTATPVLAGIGAGLMVGGGIGNVIDRVRQGHVTDFLHVTDAFGHFNVADVALTAGVVASAGALLLRLR